MQIHVPVCNTVYSCFIIFQVIVQNYVYKYIPACQFKECTGQLLQLYQEKKSAAHFTCVYTNDMLQKQCNLCICNKLPRMKLNRWW